MKSVPFTASDISDLLDEHPTPFYIYDEQGIRDTSKKLFGAFDWANGYKNYFAVKALPNPEIMKVLQSEGMGFDVSSLAELVLAEKVSAKGEDIMFTSNDTPVEDFQKAKELEAVINFDDISHIEFYEKNVGPLPDLVCFRYNPGPNRQNQGNVIIGNPEEAKYGLTKDQLFEAYKIAKNKGSKRFGLHTMVVSNELNPDALVETAQMLADLYLEIKERLGIELEFVNLGGGFGIPYSPEEKPLDLKNVKDGIQKAVGDLDLKVFTENGRFVTGPHGYLVTSVRHIKDTYKKYIGTDASMSDLMRPGMYGAYHHITVIGKEGEQETYDVTGSLCENNDKFAIDRKLPKIKIGDILVIHDAGAHGHAMGFNYNGKLRSAEFLMHTNKSFTQIRRAETLEDYFATLNLP